MLLSACLCLCRHATLLSSAVAQWPQEEIYSSSYAAAAYLDSIHFPKDKKVYVVGEVSGRGHKQNRAEAAVWGGPVRRERGRAGGPACGI